MLLFVCTFPSIAREFKGRRPPPLSAIGSRLEQASERDFFVIPNSPLSLACTGLVIVGALLFLYLYHVRTRSFDVGDRTQVTAWRFYGAIDLYLKVSTLAITIAALNTANTWLWEIHHSIPVSLLGLLIAGAALLLFATAMLTLDQQFTPAHQSHLPNQIIRSGPYRFIRHPIYTSNLLLMMGLFLLSGSVWIILNLLVLIAYYVPTILIEERALRSSFPEYDDHAQTTGRILPRWGRSNHR